MGASNPLTAGSQPTPETSAIIPIGGHSQEQQHQSSETTSTVALSDFSAHSPTLFSSHTIASLLFYQPITRIVVVLTILQSLLSVGVNFPDHCSAPSYTLYGGEFLGLLISPFVVPLTPALLESAKQTLGTALMLAMSNLVSFGLFEERLTMLFRGGRSRRGNTSSNRNSTRIFRNVVLVIVVLVMALRELAGIIFNRAVGFKYPSLYFSDSVHECNLGIAPFLFALLVVQAFLPDDDTDTSAPPPSTTTTTTTSIFAFRRIYVQVILCLFNVIPKAIFWWAGSGLVVGFFVSFGVAYQRRMGRWGGKVKTTMFYEKIPQKDEHEHEHGHEHELVWQDRDVVVVALGVSTDGHQDFYMNTRTNNSNVNLSKETSDDSDSDMESALPSSPTAVVSPPALPTTPFSTPMGHSKERSTSYIVKRFGGYVLPMVVGLLFILAALRQLHNYRPDVSNDLLNSSIEPSTPFLLTLVMMTAPRRDGIAFIKQTLSSYLDAFPDADESAHPLYSRIQIIVYTHITDHPAFDEAKIFFDNIPKARRHVKWVRDEGSEKNQRKHLISAIRKVGTTEDTVYLGIMEDDFPFCNGGWQTMLNTIYDANQYVENHCGVFVTTGGSGLIFKRSVALAASFVLEQDELAKRRGEVVDAPDIALQKCMLGQHEYCSSCKGNMVISKTLLQGHLGHDASTSGGSYSPSQFQCGWRHPFNGMYDTHTF
ncbi:hypothetical protein BGZ95_012064 [Linnemannia exigua]|uniref:Uncharacterized protein n=1 Tax=Linnemannia exigua TaxID=604196 RepID=A0AAD4H4T3_9FUNG|nr:hypothetical protein BGZ95_012064 [Linnemannia exigua]